MLDSLDAFETYTQEQTQATIADSLPCNNQRCASHTEHKSDDPAAFHHIQLKYYIPYHRSRFHIPSSTDPTFGLLNPQTLVRHACPAHIRTMEELCRLMGVEFRLGMAIVTSADLPIVPLFDSLCVETTHYYEWGVFLKTMICRVLYEVPH